MEDSSSSHRLVLLCVLIYIEQMGWKKERKCVRFLSLIVWTPIVFRDFWRYHLRFWLFLEGFKIFKVKWFILSWKVLPGGFLSKTKILANFLEKIWFVLTTSSFYFGHFFLFKKILFENWLKKALKPLIQHLTLDQIWENWILLILRP